jgi:predicted MFS family arabinose efflux permease
MMRGAVKPVLGFLGIGVSEDRREEETLIVFVLQLLLLLLLLLLFFLHCKVAQLLGFVASGISFSLCIHGRLCTMLNFITPAAAENRQSNKLDQTKQKLSNP